MKKLIVVGALVLALGSGSAFGWGYGSSSEGAGPGLENQWGQVAGHGPADCSCDGTCDSDENHYGQRLGKAV